MKTKKTIGICFMSLLLGLSVTSCNKWLTLEPEDGVTFSDYFQSQSDVNALVVGIYCEMMDPAYIKNLFLWGELRADMVTGGTKPLASYTSVISGEINSSNTICQWSGFYSVINNCNIVAKFADYPIQKHLDASYTQKEADQYKAEALALRGLTYFYLLRSFGEVPLVLEASLSDAQNYSIDKSSKEDVMKQILSDLTTADSSLTPSYNTEYGKGRITKWAVKAILADVYLWNEEYVKAQKCCDAIIASGKFNMIPVDRTLVYIEETTVQQADTVYYADDSQVSNLFNSVYANGNSTESIFELNFNETKTNGLWDFFSASKNVLVANAENIDANYFLPYTADANVYDIRSKSFAYKGTMVWKYMGLTRTGLPRNVAQSYADWIFYRYPEILLMKAEALIEQAKADSNQVKLSAALKLIEQVRTRANALKNTEVNFTEGIIKPTELEGYLLNERAREFMFEGKRWYDVLRFAKRNNYENLSYLLNLALTTSAPSEKQKSLQTKYKDTRSHYWPIYVTELENNPKLVQNDFYETK
jgi:starch-binding outer membrane protein, SusD/RagB family